MVVQLERASSRPFLTFPILLSPLLHSVCRKKSGLGVIRKRLRNINSLKEWQMGKEAAKMGETVVEVSLSN